MMEYIYLSPALLNENAVVRLVERTGWYNKRPVLTGEGAGAI
jgi:hypothetical protein